jgi:hypothetical protein
MKLVGFQLPLELRQHFRQELDTWLDKIHRLLMKPNDRTGRSKFYFDLLFEFPFGAVEVRNTQSLLDLIWRRYQGTQAAPSPSDIAEWLRDIILSGGAPQRREDHARSDP